MANDLPGMVFVVKAELGFKDGNIFPRRISVGEVVEVDQDTFLKMQQSDPDSIKLIERRIPRSKPAPKAKPEQEAKETPGEES